ncbi:MAG: PDZ domain-containing protein, partial [Bacteroidia bacterium]|nr:PDZ domain-containing protein [Bacteroidia bacterium]
MLKKGILLFSFITVAAISTAFIAGNEQLFEISKQLDIFTSLFKELNIYYVDEVNDEKLTRKAIDAMLENLDPYSEYYPETELEEYKMRYVSTEYGGIGALIQTRNEQIVISEPYEGFPAQQNDIRAGDVLLEVDGKSIKNFPADDVSSRLKGKPETKIKILLKRG